MRVHRVVPFVLLVSAAAIVLLFVSTAEAHLLRLPDHPRKSVLENRLVSQQENLAHMRYVARHGGNRNQRWHRAWVPIIERELAETEAALAPPLAWRETVEAWMPTYYCERGAGGWATNTGNGFYGGLQFDYGTWLAHGGGEFASRADLAAPWQQALVASRLTYDGWPNCPNP